MNEIFYLILAYAAPVAIACAVAVAAILASGVFLEAEGRWADRIPAFVFGLMIFSTTISTLLSGRNVSAAGIELFDIASAGSSLSSVGSWLLRLTTMSVLLLCLARLGSGLFRRKQAVGKVDVLYLAFMLFFVCNTVPNAIFGTQPTFMHGVYYTGFLFTLIHSCRHYAHEPGVAAARNALLALLLLSCLVAVIKPDLAVQRNYAGMVPGLSIRFWGLGSNPNSIGPLAVLAILLLLYQPFVSKLMQRAAFCLCFLVLLLSQSKTAFGGLLFSLAVMRMPRLLPAHAKAGTAVLAIAGICFLTVGAIASVLFFIDVPDIIDRLQTDSSTSEVLTLTGRTELWGLALDAWLENPVFGYGLRMWDAEYRLSLLLPHAFSAHNQYLQVLGKAGILGLVALLVYLWVLLAYAWRASAATRGFSIGLLAFILIRTISETPLSPENMLNGDLFAQALLFHVLIVRGARKSEPVIAGSANALPRLPMQRLA